MIGRYFQHRDVVDMVAFYSPAAVPAWLLPLLSLVFAPGAWAQTQLGSSLHGARPISYFGFSVSMSADGSRLAAAPYSNDDVRVYQWDADTSDWVQQGSGLPDGDYVALSTDGLRVAIGDPYDNDAGVQAGKVRIYGWDAGLADWAQLGADLNGDAADDNAGFAVSLSANGSRLAVGAIRPDASGYVRVYRWNTGSAAWERAGSDLQAGDLGDWFGHSVALTADGARLVVGAPYHNGAASRAGTARVYDWDAGSSDWVQTGDISGGGSNHNAGYSVSIAADGGRVALAANGSGAGHAEVHRWNAGTSSWVQVGTDIYGEVAGDIRAQSVSLSADGSQLAVGAPGYATGTGHARWYRWNAGSAAWERRGNDIYGQGGENLGYWVSLAGDSTRLAVGAPQNDDAGGTAGRVQVFGFPAPDFSLGVNPGRISVSGTVTTATLTYGIDNSRSTVAATSLDFSHDLPAGVQLAGNGATTCTGGTLTAVTGTGTLAYTGGTVAAGASCSVSVDVTASSGGVFASTTGSLTSSLGDSGTASATLTVDDAPPVIAIAGDNPLNLVHGSPYSEPGATAVDDFDGAVAVTITGAVNSDTPDTYTITYSASDAVGNAAQASRTVTVLPPRDYSAALPGGGTGALSIASGDPGCALDTASFVAGETLPPPPEQTLLSHGAVAFTVSGCNPGASITVTMDYGATLPAGAGVWKSGTTWWPLPGASVSGSRVSFQVTDGGPGDADGAANGSIVDPFAVLASTSPARPVPTLPLPGLLAGALGLLLLARQSLRRCARAG